MGCGPALRSQSGGFEPLCLLLFLPSLVAVGMRSSLHRASGHTGMSPDLAGVDSLWLFSFFMLDHGLLVRVPTTHGVLSQ